MADLSKIKPSDRTIEIKSPVTGNAIGVRVRIMSIEDDRLQKVKRKITDERLRLEQRGKPWKAEEIEDNKHNIAFSAMIDWDWYNPTGTIDDKDYDADEMPDFEGEVPDFNRRNVVNIFTKLPWFLDQINEEIGETKAFFNSSKAT